MAKQKPAAPSNSTAVVALTARMTIETIEALAEHLRHACAAASDAPLQLDGAGIEAITTPGAQLILSVLRSLRAQGRDMHILNPSTAMQQNLTSMGLGTLTQPPTQQGA